MDNQETATAPLGTLVIGAARGIGAAVARQLAGLDWPGPLAIADVNEQGLASVVAELNGRGMETRSFVVDISDPAAIERLAFDVGPIDHLALISGVMGAEPALESTAEGFARILGVNLVGVYLCAQAFARGMAERGAGSIVAISSTGGRQPTPNLAAYAASKAGLPLALNCLALEVSPLGVRINTVCPGGTDTDMPRIYRAANGLPEPRDPTRSTNPLGRMNTPDEVASVVRFLLSPDSSAILMRDIVVDGGLLRGLD